MPLLCYEQFCANPVKVIDILRPQAPKRFVDSINPDSKVIYRPKKGALPAKLENKNPKAMANLSQEQINILSSVFAKHEELLAYYGYHIL